MDELNESQSVDAIMEKLGPDDGSPPPETSEQTQESVPTEGDPETVIAEEEPTEQEDDRETVIAAPDSWNAAERAAFMALPDDLKTVIARRDAEQKSTFNRQINEAAESKRAAEQERQAAAQERQRYAQSLEFFTKTIQTTDPVLAAAQRMTPEERLKFANEDPAGFQVFKEQVEQSWAKLQAARQQQQALEGQQRTEALQEGHARLVAAIPEWKDEAKRAELSGKIGETLKGYGLSADEVASIIDPRFILAGRDLMEFQQMKAAQKAAAAKKTVVVPKVAKPGASREERGPSARANALFNKAVRTGKEADAVEAILARI